MFGIETKDLRPSVSSSSHGNPSNGTVTTSSLNLLQSKEHLELLNEIDQLRSSGVNEFVSLPQLVVCGDQSSGKSSVLEAIAEIPFPRHDNLCTRFATQIVLRRSPMTEARVKIIPSHERNAADQKKLSSFAAEIADFSELPALIDQANTAMGVGQQGNGAFSRDTLSIEILGPDKPQLTIVDLPGLIHTENRVQSKADVELVSEIVRKYMTDQRTIILAIVTAKNDFANQIVLQKAKEADPEGVRTLGIITKPDTLPSGSESEANFISLAKNNDIYFKLGWHVLRNRNYEERNCSFFERNQNEQLFFSLGAWCDVDTGIDKLRTRLSAVLLNHIKRELPRVHREITAGLKECEKELAKMGPPRRTPAEQKMLLLRASERFGDRCKATVEGNYEAPFFDEVTQDCNTDVQHKRLRAKVQALNIRFANTMRLKGHWRDVVKNGETLLSGSQSNGLETITVDKAVHEWVKPLLVSGRGRELPGSFSPLLIGELFWAQSVKWEKIARRHIKRVFKQCETFLKVALQDLAPADVVESLFIHHIDVEMKQRLQKSWAELEELLNDRRRHAITYNHYYTDNIQRLREKRFRQRVESAIGTALQHASCDGKLTKKQLMEAINAPGQADMDIYACEEALDAMLAFYKVACKTFIDNVAIIVVERRMINNLWDIFSPLSVVRMTDDTVASICEEFWEDQKRREQLEKKQKSLKAGLDICRMALRGKHSESLNLANNSTLEVITDSDSDSDSELDLDSDRKTDSASGQESTQRKAFTNATFSQTINSPFPAGAKPDLASTSFSESMFDTFQPPTTLQIQAENSAPSSIFSSTNRTIKTPKSQSGIFSHDASSIFVNLNKSIG